MDSSEDDEQTENYHNFFNFSILNEGKLVVKFLTNWVFTYLVQKDGGWNLHENLITLN